MKLRSRVFRIPGPAGLMRVVTLSPAQPAEAVPGILWLHGGGYMMGGPDMLLISRGKTLAARFGAVAVSPGYRLAWQAPYPAALEDCYAALRWMYDNADALGIDRSRIVIGGESAGGGLAAALCLYARDKGELPVALQLPLYPMLDCEDTPSSRDNHWHAGWGTRRNHWGWRHYLGDIPRDKVSKYASAARETDYSGLPPCYTFVAEGEAFRDETLSYVQHLRDAGLDASVDVFPGTVHSFDLMCPWRKSSRDAIERLCEEYGRLI